MNTKKRIKVQDYFSDGLLVTKERGKEFYDILSKYILSNQPVMLDFSNTKVMISVFTNNSLGKLYLLVDPKKLTELVEIDPDTVTSAQSNIIDRSITLGRELFEKSRSKSEDKINKIDLDKSLLEAVKLGEES